MKFTFPKLPLAGTLLVSYVVYSTFVPVSTAHSIILFSLAGFSAFEQYINSHKTPSIRQDVKKLRLELLKEMETQKESYEQKLAELKQEQQRFAIERANSVSASSKTKQSIQF